ncbi:MAG: sensor histidine kinase [Steroidobacteraceae bacterium]
MKDSVGAARLPGGLLECVATSGVISWFMPDVSSTRFWISDDVLETLGYTCENSRDEWRFFLEILHPNDRVRVLERQARAIAGEPFGGRESELRLRHRAGHYLWTSNLTMLVSRTGGAAPAAFGILSLHGPQELPSALKLTEDTLQSVLDEIGHPVVLLSTTGHIIHANEATARVIGTRARHSPGHYCPFLHEESGASTEPDYLSSVISSGCRAEREIWRFDRWWRTFLVPLRIAAGQVSRILLLAQDITELKEEQARQIAREKALTRTLVREVHHRIKNHLQGLIGLLRSMKTTGRPADQLVGAAVARIASIAIVHGLLTSEGNGALDFAELVRQITATLRIDAPVELRWSANVRRSAPLSQANAVPLALVVGELLTNALKHTPRQTDALVEVNLLDLDSCLELQITNSPAFLPQDFSLQTRRGIQTGLDLVATLLPRDNARLEIFQKSTSVITRLTLRPNGRAGL